VITFVVGVVTGAVALTAFAAALGVWMRAD